MRTREMKKLKVGDRVRLPTISMSGTITDLSDTAVFVKWDDGKENGWVHHHDGDNFKLEPAVAELDAAKAKGATK